MSLNDVLIGTTRAIYVTRINPRLRKISGLYIFPVMHCCKDRRKAGGRFVYSAKICHHCSDLVSSLFSNLASTDGASG